jgi:hypothetical protein
MAWINAQEQLESTAWARYIVIPDKTQPTNIEDARGQLLVEAQWAVVWGGASWGAIALSSRNTDWHHHCNC